MWTTARALRLNGTTLLTNAGVMFDWQTGEDQAVPGVIPPANDPQEGYFEYLVRTQQLDGNWLATVNTSNWTQNLNNAWGLLILLPTVFGPPNQPPVAVCQNAIRECAANQTENISVDGGSFDPDGDPITLVQAPPPPYNLFPPGVINVTLTVTDTSGASDQCSAMITIQDTTAPSVGVSTGTTTLWPPNHKLVDVGLSIVATDGCDEDAAVTTAIVSVTSDEPAEDQTGDGHHSPDARFIKDANDNVTGLRLRSERKGNSDGRVYLIVVEATDGSGNTTTECAAVTVTHSQNPVDQTDVAAQAAAAVAACPTPLAHNVLGPPPDGPAPEIGPKQ
jgi:hypothetical protein